MSVAIVMARVLTLAGMHTCAPPACTYMRIALVGCSLDYDDPIRDGFWDPWGDWPEVVDQPSEFPTLAVLRRVHALDDDPREVRPWKCWQLIPTLSRPLGVNQALWRVMKGVVLSVG